MTGDSVTPGLRAILVGALCLVAPVHAETGGPADPARWWVPAQRSSWQWQLTGPIDQSFDVDVYDIDLFDADAGTVASLRAKGARTICYMSAGARESWRPDSDRFPPSIIGEPNGWPGERWLDIRQIATLRPIMEARLDLCKAKGFDAVEPDNVDGYANRTGFPLTAAHQVIYNRFLAQAAHERGLSIGLKNAVELADQLEPYFDWTLNEQCFRYEECDLLMPFIKAGKAVFHVEYELEPSRFCPEANEMNFNSLSKRRDLDAHRVACR